MVQASLKRVPQPGFRAHNCYGESVLVRPQCFALMVLVLRFWLAFWLCGSESVVLSTAWHCGLLRPGTAAWLCGLALRFCLCNSGLRSRVRDASFAGCFVVPALRFWLNGSESTFLVLRLRICSSGFAVPNSRFLLAVWFSGSEFAVLACGSGFAVQALRSEFAVLALQFRVRDED